MFEKEIKDSFYSIVNNNKERKPKELYVTEILWCLRKAYFNYIFNAKPRKNMPMVLGSIYHDVVQRLPFWEGKGAKFEVDGLSIEYEGYTISGRPDVITENPKAVWEFKFPYRAGNEPVVKKYIMQLNTYLMILDIDVGYLVEVEFSWRDRDINVHVTEHHKDKLLYEKFIERANILINCLESDQIPPRTDLHWECRDCPYKIICDKIDMNNSVSTTAYTVSEQTDLD